MLLLLGGSGMLGREFLDVLKYQNIKFLAPRSAELNILNLNNLRVFCKKYQINKIINCVAYTQVDLAEIEFENCFKINTEAIKNLIALNIPIINFSTDYIFNAPQGLEIPENFARFPLNIYGESKKQAEILLENSTVKFWNIRTSWLFGKYGNNFITTILELAKKHSTLSIINDQIGRPTSTQDLAFFVVKHFILKTQKIGHYHLQNSGNPISWANFARFFLDLQAIKTSIRLISSVEFATSQQQNNNKIIAQRPKNSVLKNTKISQNLPDWQTAVEKFLEN